MSLNYDVQCLNIKVNLNQLTYYGIINDIQNIIKFCENKCDVINLGGFVVLLAFRVSLNNLDSTNVPIVNATKSNPF